MGMEQCRACCRLEIEQGFFGAPPEDGLAAHQRGQALVLAIEVQQKRVLRVASILSARNIDVLVKTVPSLVSVVVLPAERHTSGGKQNQVARQGGRNTKFVVSL